MTIQPTVLHPENNPDVDLHPETDAGQVTDFLNKTYPVGSVYMSYQSTSPASLFGGTWTAITSGFLVSAGYSGIGAGDKGGSPNAVVVSHTHHTSSSGNSFKTSSGYNLALNAGGSGAVNYNDVFTLTVTHDTDGGTYMPINLVSDTNSSGVSGTGANMPPYYGVYMWRRVA